jgi:hypothetical protein
LIPLISQVTSDVDLQHFLISIYDETSNDEYTKSMFGGKTEEEAKRKIAVHVDLFSKKLYRGSPPQMTFNLKGDDMINLAYLMYLDMLHDGTIKNNMTFETFCEAKIVVSVKEPAPTKNDKKATKMAQKIQESPVYILFGTGIKPKETDFIKTVQGFIDESSGKAEIAVKSNLPSIYPNILKKEMTIQKDQVSPRILTQGHNMFLSIDQEDEKATVTLDIQKTKYELLNGTTGKIMYPLVSVANLMDPGKNMLIESGKEDSKYFMGALGNNRDIQSRLTWNYNQPKFTINHDNGSTTIEAYYTDIARITNNANNKRKTKRGYAYRIKNGSNEYGLSSNMSKAKAQIGSTGDKVAKFLGDFLQALTVCSYIKNNSKSNYHYCLATGDAMLANNFIFLCSRSGVSPNLWMATSTKQISKVYGKMIEYIQNVQAAPTEVRNAPSTNEKIGNTTQEVSSGNVTRRRVNNGVSVAGSNRGRLGGTREVKRKTPNNNNKNNGPPPTRGPTAQSGVGSRNSIVGNKNNNLNSSGNSQPNAKKAKINEASKLRNEVNKLRKNLNAKREILNTQREILNAQRKKFLNNLKNKKIPNRNIQRLMESYDNNTKTANQVIREANNLIQTLANRNKLIQNLKNKQIPNLNIQRLMKSYDNKTKTANQIIREAINLSQTRANRNKLIQNLKKKNLSNAVINNYVKSYNNGTKSVNQIIQEVRANAKRKQNAKNAATLRTLRQLRPELFN